MKRIFLILALISGIVAVNAQNLKRFYKQAVNSEGLLYFVYPQEMPVEKAVSGDIAEKELKYDYTYLDSRDSITLLCTITTSVPFKPDCMQISYHNGNEKISISGSTDILYIESKGKNWVTRLSALIKYDELKSVYAAAQPFVLTFSNKEDGQVTEYRENRKKWRKTSQKFTKLFQIIDYNK